MHDIHAAGMFGLGGMEVMILIGLAVVLFGARRLPELGRSLGKGLVEFKKGLKGLEDDDGLGGSTARTDVPNDAPRPPQKIGNPPPKFDDGQAHA